MQSELMTSRQVAAEVGKTVETVNQWVRTGRLTPALVVPGYHGARLFDPASVEALRQEKPE